MTHRPSSTTESLLQAGSDISTNVLKSYLYLLVFLGCISGPKDTSMTGGGPILFRYLMNESTSRIRAHR
jgi:hypothetical protein